MEQAPVPSKSPSTLHKVLRALLVALAITGTAVGAAACGPSSHKTHSTTPGPGGY